jgi:hypothetical protein
VNEPELPDALEPRQRTRANYDPITSRWTSLVFHVPASEGEVFADIALAGWVGRTLPLRFPGGHEEEVRIIAATLSADGLGYSLTVAPLEAQDG